MTHAIAYQAADHSRKALFATVLAVLLAGASPVLGATCGAHACASAPSKDIVQTAAGAGSFKTLTAAVEAAGLVDALRGKGPFTVFAPTDEAFAKLPKSTIATLLKPENKALLTSILTYHVVPGRVPASDVVQLSKAKTLNGQQVDIRAGHGGVRVDKANVTKTDIFCSNGVIHVIDSVIMPSTDDIVSTAVKAGQFNTLAAALKAAGLVEALRGKGPFTVFAPTDAAFAKLPKGTVQSLLKPENKAKLQAILKYHVVAGARIFAADALKAGTAATLQGRPIAISKGHDGVRINQSRVARADIDASNGVIHVIDRVLLPPEPTHHARQAARMKIVSAINRGAPMYNAGNHAGCADLYMQTGTDLARMSPSPLGTAMHNHLQRIMAKARNTHCPTQRAWAMRHALDAALASLTR